MFIFLIGCSPVNNKNVSLLKLDDKTINNTESLENKTNDQKTKTETEIQKNKTKFFNVNLNRNIDIIISSTDNKQITDQFINVTELAVYNKNLVYVNFNIATYKNTLELDKLLSSYDNLGKVYIGPLNSKHTKLVKKYCQEGAIFFSFSSERDLAGDCVFLINFFPKNEIKTLFDFFPNNSKVAILYPENIYGYAINFLVDQIAFDSDSVIVNRSSYKADMSNLREAIKELGKYELRKYELTRQKTILAKKNDSESKKRLKKLKKFKTTKDLDFTHVLIADYGIRLLQVVPLLPYYDIDPNVVKFVGTGVWDDPAFFDEPSLQNAFFAGVELAKRKDLFEQYTKIYDAKPLRISTLPYDLIGLLSYVYGKKQTLDDLYKLLNNKSVRFDGVDGNFYFDDNIIERDLSILKISNGEAKKVN